MTLDSLDPPTAAVRRSGAAKRLTLLGATGSIGRSTISVLKGRPGAYAVEAVTANKNGAELAAIARDVDARLAVVADPGGYADLKAGLAGTGIEAAAGADALDAAAASTSDLVVAAVVGAAGLRPTMAAITAGRDVALANKECLVCAGTLFMAAVKHARVRLLPIDSEHNAIFQAMESHNRSEVEKIVLTASGGPFRGWSADALGRVTVADALKHPKWSMGRKVTIDSSTLMNKGLEIIEAHHLFGMNSGQIEVLVHPQSVVHGIVAYSDGSMIAQMAAPDMRTPIAHCLNWPARGASQSLRLDLAAIGTLTFETPDTKNFPALEITRQALALGGAATNILNAANEVAVMAFLDGTVSYLAIAAIVADTLDAWIALADGNEPQSVQEAMAIDQIGRRIAAESVARRGGS